MRPHSINKKNIIINNIFYIYIAHLYKEYLWVQQTKQKKIQKLLYEIKSLLLIMCYIYLAQHYKEYLGVQQNKQKIITPKIVIAIAMENSWRNA